MSEECSNEFCTSKAYSHGLCRRHYDKLPHRREAIRRANARYAASPKGKEARYRAAQRLFRTEKGLDLVTQHLRIAANEI